MTIIKKGKYRHYKGHLYEVTGTARHSETLEDMGFINKNFIFTASILRFTNSILKNMALKFF